MSDNLNNPSKNNPHSNLPGSPEQTLGTGATAGAGSTGNAGSASNSSEPAALQPLAASVQAEKSELFSRAWAIISL